MEQTRENLTKAMRWEIADKLAEDRLEMINAKLEEAVLRDSFYICYGKRILDFILSLIALIITFPVNIVLGIATFFDVGWPVFFTQERTGKGGKPFTIIKFRNMTNDKDERGELLPASKRVTKWGRFVRSTSLDELLNFISVLKGDMSIIGPRPLPPEYVSRYHKRHRARLLLRPGLECPPHETIDHQWTWQEHLDNDVWYVENVSFKTDLIMCLHLLQFVFNRKNAAARSAAKVGIFMGYDMNGKAISLSEVPEEYVQWVYQKHKYD